MMKNRISLILATALGVGFAAEALAQPNPNTLISQRKGAMYLQGKYFGPIFAMSQGRVPFDQRIAQRNAEYLTVITQLAWDDFQPGTIGLPNTSAKEEVLSDPARFKTRYEALQAEVQKLNAAVKSGDQNMLKASANGIASACNACHEAFGGLRFRYPVQQ
jgi:cytochrome c556